MISLLIVVEHGDGLSAQQDTLSLELTTIERTPGAVPLADDEVLCNCYFGTDANGGPDGATSTEIQEGGSCECGGGESAKCVGTMGNCDCSVGFTNCEGGEDGGGGG